MEGQGSPDAIVLDERLTAGDFLENFGGEVFAIEKQAEMRLVHGRIVEKGDEDVCGVMVEKSC